MDVNGTGKEDGCENEFKTLRLRLREGVRETVCEAGEGCIIVSSDTSEGRGICGKSDLLIGFPDIFSGVVSIGDCGLLWIGIIFSGGMRGVVIIGGLGRLERLLDV